MVPDEGIEPPTFGLQNRCSTAELIRLLVSKIAGTIGPAGQKGNYLRLAAIWRAFSYNATAAALDTFRLSIALAIGKRAW